MHEVSLMAGVLDLVNQNLSGYNVKKVKKITLKVGALTNAVPDALQLAFEALSKDTVVEGAVLEIIPVVLKVSCGNCNIASQLEEPVFRCPECGSVKVSIISGRELYLDSLEVETDGD